MIDMARLEQQLVEHEGLRLFPYVDTVGKLTVGIGRNLSDRGITKDEAFHLLRNDILEVLRYLPVVFPFWGRLSDVRQRVLADMAFNLGIFKLQQFTLTLAMIERGDYAEAAEAMLESRWAEQVGRRAKRLSRMMAEDRDISLTDVS